MTVQVLTRYNPPMDDRQQRIDLACALRWTARLDLHEGVANHFSAAVDGGRFLMNPRGRHFSQICAGDLLSLSACGDGDGDAPDGVAPPQGVDPTAWCLHGYFHRHSPRAGCLMHTHMPYATALASLDGWRLLPIDQNSCRFFDRVAYDEEFGGMLLAEEEAARQFAVIGDKPVLVMHGHGILISAPDVALAFDLMFHFERACRNQWLAMATGGKLFSITDAVAEKTAQQWEEVDNRAHFTELRRLLDAECPQYRN